MYRYEFCNKRRDILGLENVKNKFNIGDKIMEINETVDKISESALITIQKYMMREYKNRKNKNCGKT